MNRNPGNEYRSFVELLRDRAQRHPERPAVTILGEAQDAAEMLAYGQLDAQARHLAARLQDADLEGQRVLLLFPTGLEFVIAFFGCLYAGAVAVPLYPPNPVQQDRFFERLRSISGSCTPQAVLTIDDGVKLGEELAAAYPELAGLKWLGVAPAGGAADPVWRPRGLGRDALAFLQYTSGSTGSPKGVMIRHGNLLHNQRVIREICGLGSEAVFLGWVPLYHDLGLIGHLLHPIYLGAQSVLMPPSVFLRRPSSWLTALSKYEASFSGGPTFAYELAALRTSPQQREALDLSAWKVAVVGAEPVRVEVLERFAGTFAASGFRYQAFMPSYGLAEATLAVAGSRHDAPPTTLDIDAQRLRQGSISDSASSDEAVRLVGYGPLTDDVEVRIVDPAAGCRLPDDTIGEIWTSSPSVACGYWSDEVASQATFAGRLSDEPARRFLRTGDLGFTRAGLLYVTGRLKDLIIIDGENYYPHDIELSASHAHPGLRPGGCAAFGIDRSGERLVIVQEIARDEQPDALSELIASIRRAVDMQHGVAPAAVVLVPRGAIPKTSSGKLRRSACRSAFEAGELPTMAAWHAPGLGPLPRESGPPSETVARGQC